MPQLDGASQDPEQGKKDRNLDEIAMEVAEKAVAEWGKTEGELCYLKRAPEALYEKWKKQGVLPRNIDREVCETMHRTHMGVDQDYRNIVKQCTRTALADGWGGAMMATDLQDVLFGTPSPLQSEANLGIMKEDHVNVIVHGHEPVLSEMIVAASLTWPTTLEQWGKASNRVFEDNKLFRSSGFNIPVLGSTCHSFTMMPVFSRRRQNPALDS